MARIYEIKDVPASDLEAQIAILRQDGATEVTWKKQEEDKNLKNKKYTIRAIYPD